MEVLALLILGLFSFIGFIAIFFTTFGTFIMFVGMVIFAAMTDFAVITPGWLAVLFALYVFGELMEFLMTVLGAKVFGGSNWSAFGAMVGGILGAVAGLIFGGIGLFPATLLGIFLGGFFPEYLRHKEFQRSVKAGVGGVVGRVGSIVVKVGIALIMMATTVGLIYGHR